MDTKVHTVLGRDRIKEICKRNGLNESDEKKVDEILEKWHYLIGQPKEKVLVAIEILKDNPRHEQILFAMMQISFEFVEETQKEKF